MKPFYKLALAAGIAAFLADQASKYALLQIDFGAARELAVAPFFSLVKWRNEGISFGVLNGGSGSELQRALLTVLTLAIIGGLVRWLSGTSRRLPVLAIGMIIGGALGNLLDRFHYGAVVDFLYFHVMIGGKLYGYPAFNVADSCIVVGVGLLLLDSFRKSPGKAETVDEKA